MEYPPVKPHHQAMHKLHQHYIYEQYSEAFHHVLSLAGDDLFARLEILFFYFETYRDMGKIEESDAMLLAAKALPDADDIEYTIFRAIVEAKYSINILKKKPDREVEDLLDLFPARSGELFFFALNDALTRCLIKNRFEDAIKFGREVLQHAPENLVEIHARAYIGLGQVYGHLGQLDEAEVNFQAALKLFQQLGYVKYIAGAYGNLGTVAGMRFHADPSQKVYFADGVKYTKLMIDALRATSEVFYITLGLSTLGEMYADIKDYASALLYSEEAMASLRKAPTSASNAFVLHQHGQLLFQTGHYEQALAILEECVPHTKVITGENIVELYKTLSAVCSILGLWEKGYRYSQKQIEILQEYADKAKAGVQYHSTVLEEKLRLESQLHALQLTSVEERVRAQAVQLVSQTELFSKFRDELRVIAQQYPSSDPGWRAVKEKLKELPCKQIDWEKFEAEFHAVHPKFTRKLYDRFATLTPTEVKMCSLLRLNLKTHEIARLFCLSERSVETHRFNIRKKMGISREQNLVTFLNTL